MRKTGKLILGAGIAVAAIGLTPATASAAEGVSGCFSYSYEPGITTTTVYYHNRCDVGREITIRLKDYGGCNDGHFSIHVEADGKGRKVVECGEVEEVYGEEY
ncbi:hypothetical protein [Nocardia wallacei]|uniref:hypothetical protein n=1 Tax=Nocardia wallacei TaxID=480035 RepID=UPI002458C838|nr:hypothetical protein [Nocardia wallacei]